jgi:hypothetical protein
MGKKVVFSQPPGGDQAEKEPSEEHLDWTPSAQHLALLEEVGQEIAFWQEMVPWLRSWRFRVEAVREGTTASGASIEFWEFPREGVFFIEERMRLDTEIPERAGVHWIVAHELAHVILGRYSRIMQTLIGDPPDEVKALVRDTEEETVWILADAFLAFRGHNDGEGSCHP